MPSDQILPPSKQQAYQLQAVLLKTRQNESFHKRIFITLASNRTTRRIHNVRVVPCTTAATVATSAAGRRADRSSFTISIPEKDIGGLCYQREQLINNNNSSNNKQYNEKSTN
jgi:hypothetical protein